MTPADILASLPDADLRAECEARGILFNPATDDRREVFLDLMDEFRRNQRDGDAAHLEVLIIRLQVLLSVPALRIPKPTAAAIVEMRH